MLFKEFLRVRNTLLWYTVGLVAITVLIGIIAMITPEVMTTNDSGKKAPTTTTAHISSQRASSSLHGSVGWHPSGKTKVTPNTEQGRVQANDSRGFDRIPWVFLFAVAAFFAAIVSTVLGSTLALENDHLEVAWTRPRSRTAYATMLMGVDALGIIIAQLIAFAFVLAHMLIYHQNQHLVRDPEELIFAARFTLFPLAWYALIVALSASMRGRAGIVQGLIWPIALGLTGLSTLHLPEVWRSLVMVVSWINPISYVTFHDESLQATVGSTFEPLAVAALALIVIASWAAATYQWRRLQA